MHQLKVVHDDQIDAVAHFGLPRLELQSELVHHRRVVDVYGGFTKRSERVRDTVELGLTEQAAVQTLRVDLRLLGQQSLGQLLFRHLEAEDGDRLFRLQGCVHRHIEGQGRFAHRGPPRHDDQVGVLEPTGHAVEVVEARRDANHALAALHEDGDALHRGTEQVVQPSQLALVAVVRDAEHERLRLVDRLLGLDRVVVAVARDVATGRDQPAFVRLLLDDPAVVLDVGRGRHQALHRR